MNACIRTGLVAWAALSVGLAAPGTARAESAPSDPATPPTPTPLTLDAVLESVDQHFPLLQAAIDERDVRRGAARSAAGGFDTRLIALGDIRPEGFYENQGADARIEQPTRLWGARFSAGYRYGSGDFPSYDGGRLTDDAGEVRLGIALPLLRGGAIDPARADIERTGISLRRAEPEIELARIDFEREAALAYWEWLAAGLRVGVAERLLAVAQQRQDQLEGRVERGAQAKIDLVDNQRLIVDRRLKLRGVTRDLEQAAIRLSLYARNADGSPLRAARERLPTDFPPERFPPDARIEADLEHARCCHPLLRRFGLDVERLEVEARLARNELLPEVDVEVVGSQDLGEAAPGIDTNGKLSADPRSETEVKALLRFELPVQRRAARGRAEAARARLRQIERRAQFARERIVAEVMQAVEGLDAAYDQTGEARLNLRLARELRDAEERKLLLGLSNLINVNIREVQAADAAQLLIDAQAAWFRAVADYEAAVTRSL